MTLGAAPAAQAAPAPVGQGFTITPSDLAFILKQIKIAEHHAATLTPSNPCGTLVGPGPNQIPDRLSPFGLRTVDGSCNNLFPGRETFACRRPAVPRLTTPVFRLAEAIAAGSSARRPRPTGYAQKSGQRLRLAARLISNLIVDQTSTNPAAVAAAGFPVRAQPGAPRYVPCTTDPDPLADPPVVGVPAGCVPSHQTLPIPNISTDNGFSPPFNSLFTFFGQFFDHGLDQTVKGGGTVFVPLQADDPLITRGPDGIPGNGDEVPAQPGVHGADPGPEPARSGRHAGHRRRRAERRQHRLAVGGPVADLRLARVAPGLPARVRRQRRRPARLHRQAARRPGRRPDLRRVAGRPDRHEHLGRGQEAGGRPVGHPAA